DKFPRLHYINLNWNNILLVENRCFKGTILREIELGFNALTGFPEFSKVKDTLENVRINSNKITSISRRDIANLASLFRIDLSHNQISSIETKCFKKTNLRWISLNNNKLTDFPDFSEVKDTLEAVYINNNLITNI
ncbi:hypothetical protein CAPTEDRAFT_56287, partial [Capitella teleta]